MAITLKYMHTDSNNVTLFTFVRPFKFCNVHDFEINRSHRANGIIYVSGSTRLNIACHSDIDAPAAVNSQVNDAVATTSGEGIHDREEGEGSGSSKMISAYGSACGTLIICLLYKI